MIIIEIRKPVDPEIAGHHRVEIKADEIADAESSKRKQQRDDCEGGNDGDGARKARQVEENMKGRRLEIAGQAEMRNQDERHANDDEMTADKANKPGGLFGSIRRRTPKFLNVHHQGSDLVRHPLAGHDTAGNFGLPGRSACPPARGLAGTNPPVGLTSGFIEPSGPGKGHELHLGTRCAGPGTPRRAFKRLDLQPVLSI